MGSGSQGGGSRAQALQLTMAANSRGGCGRPNDRPPWWSPISMELCLEDSLLGLPVQATEQVGELNHRVGGDARLAAG